jgi:TfoX/Sxy family transcriptional regulator of competence genes
VGDHQFRVVDAEAIDEDLLPRAPEPRNASFREPLVELLGTRGPTGSYTRRMAFDQELAERIRELLVPEPDVAEARMFGGLAFLIGGHMAIAASREGGVLVRVDPQAADDLVARTGARCAVMGGRQMDGWLRVDGELLRTERQLDEWVRRGVAVARVLPPKRRKPTRP